MEIPEDISSLKVTELKEICASIGVPKSGTKKDLISRISKHSISAMETIKMENEGNAIHEITAPNDSETPMQETSVLKQAGNEDGEIVSMEKTESVTNNTADIDMTSEPLMKSELNEPEVSDFAGASVVTEPEVEDMLEPTEAPILDLDVDAEDESFLNDTKTTDEEPIASHVEPEPDTEAADIEKHCEEGEVTTPSENSVKQIAKEDEAQDVSDSAQHMIEDKSREVDGTKQKTVVVPAQGDRPSFDIKIVNPVKVQSKPVKIRKRHETHASDSAAAPDNDQEEGTSREKKRKWLTGGISDGGSGSILISTDVLNSIVSSKSPAPPAKDKSSTESSPEKSASSSKHHEENKESPDQVKMQSRPENKGDAEKGEEKEQRSERSTRVKSARGKEEDLEEGEHKSKHALISFSNVDSSKALKPVKVKGRGDMDESSAVAVNVDLPSREPDVEVPDARNPLSTIVHVMRLTRPFTIPQLKALLTKFGEVVHEEFWIDDIKSQCYVKYKEEDSAKQCRDSLYGCKWPPTNHRTLKLEYVSQIQLDDVRGVIEKGTRKRSGSSEDVAVQQKENVRQTVRRMSPNIVRTGLDKPLKGKDWRRRSRSGSQDSMDYPIGSKLAKGGSRKGTDRDESAYHVDGKQVARRELEMRDRYNERRENKRREEEERLKKEQQQQAAPVKLLDDLFRKTKAEPCVYWLPLTLDEMAARDRKRATENRELQLLEQESALIKTTLGEVDHSRSDHRPERERSPFSGRRADQRRHDSSPPGSKSMGAERRPRSPPFYHRPDRSGYKHAGTSYPPQSSGSSRGHRDSGRHR